MNMPGQDMGGMPIPDNKMPSMSMQMTFFWGKNVELLFSGWPGRSIGMYLLSLFFIFALSVTVEWLSASKLVKPGAKRVSTGLARTALHTVRVGLAFLIMLAVMSFNVGVLMAAIVGHGLGFFIFGSGAFDRSESEESAHRNNGFLPTKI